VVHAHRLPQGLEVIDVPETVCGSFEILQQAPHFEEFFIGLNQASRPTSRCW
jgi:hypothetical protein